MILYFQPVDGEPRNCAGTWHDFERIALSTEAHKRTHWIDVDLPAVGVESFAPLPEIYPSVPLALRSHLLPFLQAGDSTTERRIDATNGPCYLLRLPFAHIDSEGQLSPLPITFVFGGRSMITLHASSIWFSRVVEIVVDNRKVEGSPKAVLNEILATTIEKMNDHIATIILPSNQPELTARDLDQVHGTLYALEQVVHRLTSRLQSLSPNREIMDLDHWSKLQPLLVALARSTESAITRCSAARSLLDEEARQGADRKKGRKTAYGLWASWIFGAFGIAVLLAGPLEGIARLALVAVAFFALGVATILTYQATRA